MALQTNTTLHGYFNAGDEPTEAHFKELINSAMIPGVMGLTAIAPGTSTLAIATHGITRSAYVTNGATDAITFTLPAFVQGAAFLIVNTAADGGALLTISPDSGDKFAIDIAGAAGTDNKDIINTKATQIQYDYVKIVAIDGTGWTITDMRGTWVDQT